MLNLYEGAYGKVGILRSGRYSRKEPKWTMPFWLIPVAFFLIEGYAFLYLLDEAIDWWPLAFGALWAGILSGVVFLTPRKAGRILFGICYGIFLAYTTVQTGYYILFRQMLWISEFRYASEGSEFFSVLLQYPIGWWLYLLGLLILGMLLVWRFPKYRWSWGKSILSG